MDIQGIIINDRHKSKYFAFVKQFPGICAQADTADEAINKMNVYFKSFIEDMRNKNIQMDDEEIAF